MKYLKFSIDKLIEVIQTLMLKSVILKMISKTYNTCNIKLETIRGDIVNKLIFADLTINSIRNKFEFLVTQAKDNDFNDFGN